MATEYTTWGSICGCCGHVHDSLADAPACQTADHAGCRSQGGVTDRQVRRLGERGLRPYHDGSVGEWTGAWDGSEAREQA
jgi:hypothetical protein